MVLLLAIPALIPLARAYVDAYLQGKVATGFIIYDMAYYMANAREHFDQGFQLTYGNPYASYGTPAIYFQPQIFLLGCLQHLGLDPGLALNLFGLAALFFAVFVAVRFFEYVIGLETRAKLLGLVCFLWGGGMLSIAGAAAGFLQHKPLVDSLLTFDVSGGWWMFNFGRNLTYPTEAYYHGIFLLSLLCLMRRRLVASLLLAVLLSLSHPFTGLTLALILVTYCALELLLKTHVVTPLAFAGSIVILILHLGYYVVFLNRFADHRVVQGQWQIPWVLSHTSIGDWLYRPSTYLPALIIVGGLAAMRLFQPPGLQLALRDSRVRLFLVWFLVVFALTQHNLILAPHQPVHFAHGYDWMALFFLGAPVMLRTIDRLWSIRLPAVRYAAIGLLLVFVLLDNLIWYGSFFSPARHSQALTLTRDQNAVLDWLDRNARPPEMVVCQDELVSYLVSTYSTVHSWRGHHSNTPFVNQRREEVQGLFLAGRVLPEWDGMPVLYVALQSTKWIPPPGSKELYHNNQYIVWGNQRV
jgi:hypothetical protein